MSNVGAPLAVGTSASAKGAWPRRGAAEIWSSPRALRRWALRRTRPPRPMPRAPRPPRPFGPPRPPRQGRACPPVPSHSRTPFLSRACRRACRPRIGGGVHPQETRERSRYVVPLKTIGLHQLVEPLGILDKPFGEGTAALLGKGARVALARHTAPDTHVDARRSLPLFDAREAVPALEPDRYILRSIMSFSVIAQLRRPLDVVPTSCNTAMRAYLLPASTRARGPLESWEARRGCGRSA